MSRTYYCANCLNSFTQETDVCPNLACRARKPRKGWGRLLGSGDTFDRRYHIIKMLAVGGAGITYLGREMGADDEPIEPDLALKVLFHQRDSGPFLRRLANEAQILQDLDHPNIVECRGFVKRVGSEPYLLTLFERGGNLQEHIRRVGPVPPSVAAGILRQILYALDTGHKRGIIHRDLKPQNVLLRARVTRDLIPRCLVADFGIAKVSGALADGLTQVGTFIGTPEYASPEQFTGEAPEPAADVFAAGAVLYFTLTGKTPVTFSHRTDIGTSIRELLEGIPPAVPKTAGTAEEVAILQEVLNNTMVANVKDRWAVRKILEHLQKLGRSDAWLLSDDPVEVPPAPVDPLHTATMVPGCQADDDEQQTFIMPVEPPPPPPEPPPEPEPPREPIAPPEPKPALAAAPPQAPPKAPPAKPEPTPIPPPTPTGRIRLQKKTPDWRETPAPQQPKRSGFSLDDLFGASTSGNEVVHAPPPDEGNDLNLDDLLAGPPSDPTPIPTPVAPSLPPPNEPPAPALSDAPTQWTPKNPLPPPHPLPEDVTELLKLLPNVHPEHRPPIIAVLQNHQDLQSALGSYRGGEVDLGRGIALAIGELEQTSRTAVVRTLLANPDAGIRCCAAEAMGRVGTASMLTVLSRLLSDKEASVRASAGIALARACVTHNRQSLAKNWLKPIEKDQEPLVQAAWQKAMELLES